jgi:hypothetical protein
MPTPADVQDAVVNALNRLLYDEGRLLWDNVNERTLTHRFAVYLEHEVDGWTEAGWSVDCEYNRDVRGGNDYAKTLNLNPPGEAGAADDDATTVYPDVIVHRRQTTGEAGANLLVVEFKKSTSPKDEQEWDRATKLPAYVAQLEYKYALFVLLMTRKQVGYEMTWVHPMGDTQLVDVKVSR